MNWSRWLATLFEWIWARQYRELTTQLTINTYASLLDGWAESRIYRQAQIEFNISVVLSSPREFRPIWSSDSISARCLLIWLAFLSSVRKSTRGESESWMLIGHSDKLDEFQIKAGWITLPSVVLPYCVIQNDLSRELDGWRVFIWRRKEMSLAAKWAKIGSSWTFCCAQADVSSGLMFSDWPIMRAFFSSFSSRRKFRVNLMTSVDYARARSRIGYICGCFEAHF